MSQPPRLASLPAAAAASECDGGESSASTSVTTSRWSWGSNGSGCLGLGHRDDLHRPTPCFDAVRFTKISCGGCHTLALDDLGRVWAWGENAFSQLGLHEESTAATGLTKLQPLATSAVVSTPRIVAALADSRCEHVSAGWTHSVCVAITDSSPHRSQVYTWGDNRFIQCGHPSSTNIPFPTAIESLRDANVLETCAAWKHTLALACDGRVCSWGDNAHGQLGLGDLLPRDKPTFITLQPSELDLDTSLTNAGSGSPLPLMASAIAAGWKHSLFLSHDRAALYACGSNAHGQCGIELQEVATVDSSHAAATADSASSSSPPISRARAKRQQNKISWPTPVVFSSTLHPASPTTTGCTANAVASPGLFSSIAAGWSHSLVLTTSNQLFGFGRADLGQLASAGLILSDGNHSQPPTRRKMVPTPTLLQLPSPSCCGDCESSTSHESPVIRLIACGSEHSLVVTDRDLLMCGWNEHGNLGLGHCDSTPGFTSVPLFHRCASHATAAPSSTPHAIQTVATGGAAVLVVATMSP